MSAPAQESSAFADKLVSRYELRGVEWRAVLLLCAGLVLLPWLGAALSLFGLSSYGSESLRGWDFILLAPLLCLAPAFVVVGIGLLFGKALRKKGLLMLAAGIVALMSIGWSLKAINFARDRAFTDLADRSMPLVEAIKKFEADHGTPPVDLKALVPDYLNEVPGTGIGMYPNYRYSRSSGETADAWVLSVGASTGILNWDRFIYLPSEQYPERGWGGWVEPMGRWAYVHE